MQILPRQKVITLEKKSGIKLHIGVDTLVLPHTILVTTANVTDRNGTIIMIGRYRNTIKNLSSLKKVLVDGGYTGEKFANAIKSICDAEAEVVKRSELHTFSVLPKRWIVERTFGWLDKCRRLWKNCERKFYNTFHMFTIAFIHILLNGY